MSDFNHRDGSNLSAWSPNVSESLIAAPRHTLGHKLVIPRITEEQDIYPIKVPPGMLYCG